MKKVVSMLLAVTLTVLLGFTAFAANPVICFESSYDAEKNQISVVIYVEDPGAVQAADFRLAYDHNVYKFAESVDDSTISDLMIVSGDSVTDKGLATCSIAFTEKCEDSFLTDGKLFLTTFVFTPLTEEYDINDFCLWVYSYDVNGTDISNSIDTVGVVSLKDGKTGDVTAYNENSGSNGSSASGADDTKWYVYVIAIVLGVAVIAGIAVIAIKSNKENEDNTETDNNQNASEDNS